MIYTVKKGIDSYRIMKCDKKISAFITVRKGSYIIKNPAGDDIITIHKINPTEFEIKGSAGNGSAVMALREQSFIFRPPFADCITLDWNDTDTIIRQTSKRDFDIFSQGDKCGTIDNMLRPFPRIDLTYDCTPEFAALLFSFANIMLHEDDVDII